MPFVLEEQLGDAGPAGDDGAGEQRRVALGVADEGVVALRQHQLAIAPHSRGERAAADAQAGVEQRSQPAVRHWGRAVAELEQAAAGRAALAWVGRGELLAAGGAHLPAHPLAHVLASLRTSLRMPPAVTAGPAPGPVITSGLAR